MREESFSLQSTVEANFLNIELPDNPQIDLIAEKVIREDRPEFLIPYRDIKVNGKITLKYKLINTVALAYSDRNLNKNQFIKLYMSLLNPFIKGKDWFLDYHNFCVDEKYIFLDKQTMDASYIYVPEKSYRNQDEEIIHFFRKIFNEITIVNDPIFQVKMYQYFTADHVNFTDLYQLLQKEQRVEVQPAVTVAAAPKEKIQPKTPAAVPKAEVKPPERKVEQKVQKPEDVAIDALFGGKEKKKEGKARNPEKKKGVSFNLFGKKKTKEEPLDRTNDVPVSKEPFLPFINMTEDERPVTNDGYSDRTETEDEYGKQPYSPAYLKLVHSDIPGAIERIDLGFAGPYIIIGRSSSDEVQPDVAFGKEFTRIGRKHVRIERAGNGYHIIDLGSANHTLLNDQVLIPNQPYPLVNDAIVQFTTSKPVKYQVVLPS